MSMMSWYTPQPIGTGCEPLRPYELQRQALTHSGTKSPKPHVVGQACRTPSSSAQCSTMFWQYASVSGCSSQYVGGANGGGGEGGGDTVHILLS